MSKLKIENLFVSVNDKEILKGLSIEFSSEETIALLGPNGNGKSTLLQTIMGNPNYTIKSGNIWLDDKDITKLTVDERSKLGLFLGMQYPSEVPGVNNSDFLKSALNAHREKPVSLFEFYKILDNAYKQVHIPFEMSTRNLNEGFSGGEKKKNEILQMKMLKPNFAILDEIDSGLDVDALKIVGENVSAMVNENFGCLLITHYQRLLDYIKPDYVHILIKGKIVKTGGPELIEKIDQEGYDWVKKELGIKDEYIPKNVNVLGTCANKVEKK